MNDMNRRRKAASRRVADDVKQHVTVRRSLGTNDNAVIEADNSYVLNGVVGGIEQNRSRRINACARARQAMNTARADTIDTGTGRRCVARGATRVEGDVGIGSGIGGEAGDGQAGS